MCGESEEDLREIVGRFIKVCWIKGLIVTLLGDEEGLRCEVCVNVYVFSMSRNLNIWG